MMTWFVWSDAVGILGVSLVLGAYFALQTGKLHSQSFYYSFINLIGALLILVSLMYTWNTASVLIEIVWILISCYGLYRVSRKAKNVVHKSNDQYLN